MSQIEEKNVRVTRFKIITWILKIKLEVKWKEK